MVYYEIGVAHAGQKKWAEAEAAYRKSITLKPDYPSSYYNLGLTLESLNRRDEAIPYFRTAVKLNPDLIYAHQRIGDFHVRNAQFAEAKAAYDECLKRNPGDSGLPAWYG